MSIASTKLQSSNHWARLDFSIQLSSYLTQEALCRESEQQVHKRLPHGRQMSRLRTVFTINKIIVSAHTFCTSSCKSWFTLHVHPRVGIDVINYATKYVTKMKEHFPLFIQPNQNGCSKTRNTSQEQQHIATNQLENYLLPVKIYTEIQM